MVRDRAILFLAVGQTLIWAGLYYVFPALLLRWEQALGWSKADLTAAITMAVLISALAAPLSGRIIDRGRGDILMAGAAVLGGAGLLALSQVTALWQFYLVWGCIGLAMAGCLYEPCFAMVTRARGGEAKRAIIFITLAAGFAGTISFPTVHVLADAFGWRTTVAAFGIVVIVIVAPLLWAGAHGLEHARRATPQPAPKPDADHRFLRNPVFWFLAFGFGFVAIVHGATLHHLLPILDAKGLSADIAVLAASFIGPMQVAGRLAVMATERHTTHHGVALTAFATMGLAVFILLISGGSLPLLSVFIILFGGAYGTVSILRPVIARDILGDGDFGAKSGALAVPYLVGSATAPYLGALIWAAGGYGTLLTLLVGLEILGCGLYLIAHRLEFRTL